ncbi:MAG TPA: sugar ABC transporter permease [Chloroflexota bacterium]
MTRSRSDRLAPWLMILPATLFTVAMIGFPLVYALFMAVTDFTLSSVANPAFIGLGNLQRAAGDPVFWTSVRVTLALFLLSLAFELVLGTYIGLLLSRQLRGSGLFRVLSFFPSVIPSVAVGMIWVQLLDPAQGAMNYLLSLVGVPRQLWLSSPLTVVPTLAMIDIWEWTPFIALIVVGGMQALPSEPFEAARIDGASDAQVLRFITLPMLRSTIVVAAMLRSVDLMRIFDTIYITTQGGPVNSSMSLNVFAFTQGFLFSNMGYASAVMLILMALVAAVSWGLGAVRKGFAQ